MMENGEAISCTRMHQPTEPSISTEASFASLVTGTLSPLPLSSLNYEEQFPQASTQFGQGQSTTSNQPYQTLTLNPYQNFPTEVTNNEANSVTNGSENFHGSSATSSSTLSYTSHNYSHSTPPASPATCKILPEKLDQVF
uniref:Uncharacterized protein n=1 Tax=Cacopsylla melanoneura TaxID=428564 RepID=A0A8D9FCJ2_9HEMI